MLSLSLDLPCQDSTTSSENSHYPVCKGDYGSGEKKTNYPQSQRVDGTAAFTHGDERYEMKNKRSF